MKFPKPLKKKKKKSPKKISLNKYDIIWARMVRERDKRCLVCGNTQNLQAHHLFRRGISSTRYSLDNGQTLCSSCHTFNFQFSAHKTEQSYKIWVQAYLGPDRYAKLEAQSKIIMPRKKAVQLFENTLFAYSAENLETKKLLPNL